MGHPGGGRDFGQIVVFDLLCVLFGFFPSFSPTRFCSSQVKENIPEEIKSFREDVWSEPLFMDEKLDFYTAVGGGKTNKYSTAGFLASYVDLAHLTLLNSTKIHQIKWLHIHSLT